MLISKRKHPAVIKSFKSVRYGLSFILLFIARAYDSYYPSRYLSAENYGLKTELFLTAESLL